MARKISVTRNKSPRKMLNKIGSSIEPCGTPKSISSYELYAKVTMHWFWCWKVKSIVIQSSDYQFMWQAIRGF